MSANRTPDQPHPFAHQIAVTDEWREHQAEMRAEAGCVGDDCDGCPECWVPELEQTGEQE
jgi:hypothetical protein